MQQRGAVYEKKIPLLNGEGSLRFVQLKLEQEERGDRGTDHLGKFLEGFVRCQEWGGDFFPPLKNENEEDRKEEWNRWDG